MTRRISLHLVPGGDAPRWLPAESRERFQPGKVFLSPGWCAHSREPGEHLFLELVRGGRRVALCTVPPCPSPSRAPR